jgi:alpha-L-fucosidase
MSTHDLRFTEGKDGAVYAFCLAEPQPGENLMIAALGTAGRLDQPVKRVSLLGCSQPLEWRQEEKALRITYPANMPLRHAVVFKIEH